MAGRPTTPERHLIAARRQAAITMRLAGVDYLSIGRKLAADPFINTDGKPYPYGYGVERYDAGQEPPSDRGLAELVKQDLHRVLRQRRGKIAEGAEHLVLLQEQRLDRLLAAVWQTATTGDATAVASALKIMERQAKLRGLDGPTRTEHSGPGGAPLQVEVTAADREAAIASVISYREDQEEAAAALAAAEGDGGDTGDEAPAVWNDDAEGGLDPMADGGPA